MTALALAKDLHLPLDAVTQTFLVVGKRGSGKSNTAARFVEQLHRARLPFVVLDPVDTWWGLKAGHAGGPGLDVYVFGGRKADLPLEPTGGALIAEVLCEHRISMVLSVKHLSGRARSAFMVGFAQTLFQKWAGGPLHMVLEEAHELAPQLAARGARDNDDNEAAMLGAFKRLWKLGRASGIGGTAITQRPASLSKDITTQSEILIAHRTIGPQDVKAIGEWVKYHGQHEAILGELPSLPTGQAIVWAPEFPEGQPLGLRRVQILRRDTFDSASTPKVGEQRVEPKELAAVDLERLRSKMSATLARAKADDPRELRKRIAELERQVKTAAAATPQPTVQRVEVPVIPEAVREQARAINAAMQRFSRELGETIRSHQEGLERELRTLFSLMATVADPPTPSPVQARLARAKAYLTGGRDTSASSRENRGQESGVRSQESGVGSPKLPPGEHAVLTAALQYPDGLDRKRLGILTGYKRSSRDAYILRLAQKGLISTTGGALYPTDAGRAALNGSFEPLPVGDALVAYWRQRLPEGERKTLDVLLEANGQDVPRERIDEAAGYQRSSRDAYLNRLKARGLVEFPRRGQVRAAAVLFEEA